MNESKQSDLTVTQEIAAIKHGLERIEDAGLFAEMFHRVMEGAGEVSSIVLPIGVWTNAIAPQVSKDAFMSLTSDLFDSLRGAGIDNLEAIFDSVTYDGNARREGWASGKALESLGCIARVAEVFSSLNVTEEERGAVECPLWNAATYLVRIYSHLSLPDTRFSNEQYKRWTELVVEDGTNGCRLFEKEIYDLKQEE